MKCPHCDYDEYVNTDKFECQGDSFYKLPIEMKDSTSWHHYTADVFGCPECKKVFIS